MTNVIKYTMKRMAPGITRNDNIFNYLFTFILLFCIDSNEFNGNYVL